MKNVEQVRAEGAVVDFVFRVHADGRRERFARILVVDPKRRLVTRVNHPTGTLAQFVLDAVREAEREFGFRQQRRVVVDARAGARGRT
jgi:hypothetical protein